MSIKDLKKILIKELLISKDVFITGHTDIDLDAFSSIAGFSLITKKFRKKTYVIINDKTIEASTKQAMQKIGKNLHIIKNHQAESLITPKSLLIVLDVNKANLINCHNILDKFNKVIIIDHHTKTSNTMKIDNLFIEERATSASEIVAELLELYKVKVPKTYATVLLGGIALDTNNFMYKMTKKSFYYCYYLSSKGADINEAQNLLKQDLGDYVNRAKMIANTTINGEIAIARGQKGKIYTQKELAKTADLLLEFKGIKNSFAIGYLDTNLIGVSARSINKVNAGSLMEKFGGGGNKTEAAARIENSSIKKVEEEIIAKIK